MQFFLNIHWNINPEIFRIGGLAVRYYSLMFAAAFYFSYLILSKIYKRESVSIHLLDKLAIFVILGTLIGARLGQVFFYEFGYYKHHLLEIILPFSIGREILNGQVIRVWQVMAELLKFLLL